MASSDALAQIAGLLASLPDESIEGMLVFFDTLIATSDPAGRAAAGEILRKAAASCPDAGRRERLLLAAADVDSGGASGDAAAVPDGTFGVSQEEFEARQAAMPPPPEPVADDDEDEEEEPYLEVEPPKLPHLPVRHFFPGLLVRIGRDFEDAGFGCVCAGDLYHIEACSHTGDTWTLMCTEPNIRLADAGQAAMIANVDNTWFQPVPSPSCLQSALEAIDDSLRTFEEDDLDDDVNDSIDALREDIGNCERWLSRSGGTGRAPKYRKAAVAERVFGPDHELTAWLRWLFAAVTVCIPEPE